MWTDRLFGTRRAPAPRRPRPQTRPAVERLEQVSLLSGASVTPAWFPANLHDAGVERTALKDWTRDKHSLTRAGMIDVFREVAGTGGVTGAELGDLKTLVKNADGLKMPDSVRVLSDKVANFNVANKTFQGATLLPTGALAAGPTGEALTKLVGKWFLGQDHPDLGNMAKARGGGVHYAAAEGTLYGPGARPRATDVAQGALADCYFVSSMGAVAETAPQRLKAMIADDGDGTFTIRFFNGRAADYVTVDLMLPVDTTGHLVAAGSGASASDRKDVLWPSLVEKAYAQLSEEGFSRAYAAPSNAKAKANSYDSLSLGQDIPSLEQITGLTAAGSSLASPPKGTTPTAQQGLLRRMLLSGRPVVASTPQSENLGDGILQRHVYMVTGYDARTGVITVTNPIASGNNGLLRVATFSFDQFAKTFNAFAYVTTSSAGTAVPRVPNT